MGDPFRDPQVRPAHVASTWLEQFEIWLLEALEARLPQANAMVLSTADFRGRPSARTVLLKGCDDRGFVFYTNLRSRKGREAAANPFGALVFPWHAVGRQIVVSGRLAVVDNAEADTYFAGRGRGSQLAAHASPQSEVIPSHEFLVTAWEAVAERCPADHPVPRPPRWSGLRLDPVEVEFWQGRPDRLHNRLRFRRSEGGWLIETLAP